MPTPEKEALVAQLRQDIEDGGGIYLTEFSRLTVEDMNKLRGEILAVGARLQVAKNRLLKLALQGTAAEALSEYLTGPTAITFCKDDPIAVAKTFAEFARQHEAVAIKAGLVEGKVLGRQQVEKLASLPPRDQLLAELLAQLVGPASGLVRVLSAALSDVVFTLQGIADKRQEAEA